MAKQWKQLTSEEVKNHPLNTKGGLSSFIAFMCFLSFLGLGLAARTANEVYKIISDTNQSSSQDSILLVAIIPSLIYVIIFAFLIKHKTKHTLKFVIGILWAVPIVSFFHALIFWDYVGASGVPSEVTLSILGRLIWVIIFTIGLVIYSFSSKKYNLQYLHRIEIDNNNDFNPSPQNNLDDSEQPKNTQDTDSIELSSIKPNNIPQKPSTFEDTSILQNEPTSKSIFNQEPIETEKTTSEKFNLTLSVICGTAILIAAPFAYMEYKDNLKCISNLELAENNWRNNLNIYIEEYEKNLTINKEKDKRLHFDSCIKINQPNLSGDVFQRLNQQQSINEKCNHYSNEMINHKMDTAREIAEQKYLSEYPQPILRYNNCRF